MRKIGAGTLHVTGCNEFSGALVIEEGIYRFDGEHISAGTHTISNAATMTGNGSTDAIVKIEPGASLAPSPELTIENQLSIQGTYAVDVSGAAIDQVVDINNLTLHAGSAVTVSGTLTATNYVIMTYNNRAGTFTDVSSVTTQGYDVIYDDVLGQVRLELHPDPFVMIGVENGGIIVFWPGFSGYDNRLEYSANLLLGVWLPLEPYTNLPGMADMLTATNFPPDPQAIFFQVVED